MRYADFERQIMEMAISASEVARRGFAIDTIVRLHQSASDAIRNEYTEPERSLLASILDGLESTSADVLKLKLKQLTESLERDSVRAIEFRPDVTELLCAIDSWLDYRLSCDPHFIGAIAINMVNSIDYAIGGEIGDYSINNVFGAPAMVAEHQRQERMLAPCRN